MLDELLKIHLEVITNTPSPIKRYLFERINWDAQAICLLGGRGTGKTTLMCQFYLDRYKDPSKALYLSADNLHVLNLGLFRIAQEYFQFGGQALLIDEVHKYPEWEREIKNIIDTFKKQQIIFSGSTQTALHKSKIDLSRRVVYHELKGLSFREYLHFATGQLFTPVKWEEILTQHIRIADQFKGMTILKHFKNYLNYGYFPFFLEGTQDYISKVTNVIEKIIFEDIAVVHNLRQATLPILKRLLWLVATSLGLTPNIDHISKDLRTSREVIYHCLDYLDHAGLINNTYYDAQGRKLTRKPGKVYLENTNLLYAINGSLKLEADQGNLRETFFVNQVSQNHRVNLHDQGDFIIDGSAVIEVGGPSKKTKQIKSLENAFVAVDGIEIGFGVRIPLYLFGLLY